ncbi:MAG TPA: hypothetical protein VD932_06730 [Aquabacterium sp.]|nr:hypothetical protein [Aquabacterium sp.]
MRQVALCAAVLALLAGCDQQPASPAQPSAASPPPAAPAAVATAPPAPTLEDWKKALASTYTEKPRPPTKGEKLEDGVSEFVACFDTEPAVDGKCKNLMFGKRDAFRKLTHFTPGGSMLQSIVRDPYLRTYIAVRDCQPANYFMAPQFWGESWIFMNRLGVLVDGELVLDRDFESARVERDTHGRGVFEQHHFIATDAERTAMDKLLTAKQLAVRLTGTKGYVPVDRKDLPKLQEDARVMQLVFNKIEAATKDKRPPGGCGT